VEFPRLSTGDGSENGATQAAGKLRNGMPALIRFLRWLHAFGVKRVFRMMWEETIVRAGSGRRIFYLPGWDRPVIARKNDSDTVIFEQVFVAREYQFEVPFTPNVIVDVGANAGYTTLYLALQFPRARVLAVEPDRENFALLRENVCAIPRVTFLNAGLWWRNGSLRVQNPDALKCILSLEELGPGCIDDAAVPAVTMPSIFDVLKAETIDILKIDIEGGELELFSRGANAWLSRVRSIMIELHDARRPGCAKAFYHALEALDFEQFQRGDVLFIINKNFRS
jgi:FkbM family methyltransferase